jgi:hypothetical protein
MVAPAVWYVTDFENDIDAEYPQVERPTFSRYPSPAYRLAEPGDTIDRVAIYLSSLSIVLAIAGLRRARVERKLWIAATAISAAAFWYAANPGPTFDGWHGLGWYALADPTSPAWLRVALGLWALALASLVVWGLGLSDGGWRLHWQAARDRRSAALLALAALLASARLLDVPRIEPLGFWPRWALVWGLIAYGAAIVRMRPPIASERRAFVRAGMYALLGSAAWFGLVVLGVTLTVFHRPIDRLRAVVPGRIYMSGMPSARGLAIAHGRHQFKTIINLFPEDTAFRSPKLPQELQFARTHHIQYVGSPAELALSNDFLDLTLQIAQDPNAWPILVHCHACMDRTPAWVGIYQFVVEGRPLDEVMRFIEGHRGYRPKATVTLLYNRVFPRLAPERYRGDPTAAVLRRCAEGTVDRFEEQVQAELLRANPAVGAGVKDGTAVRSATFRPSLTPRR